MEWSLAALIIIFTIAIVRIYLFRKQLVESSNLDIFITGCDTGIGNRLAIYFNANGCHVFAGCLNPSSASLSLPNSVTVVPLDVTDEDSVKEAVMFVEKTLKDKGKDLWAVINNAGVCVYGEFEWQTRHQCKKQVDVNVLGTMLVTKAFTPLLRKRKGRIITITSINGSIAYPGLSVYSATKFALEGLCNALRLELRRMHGIRVIIIQPGDFARLTSIMSQHRENAQQMWDNMSEEDKHEFGDFFNMYHSVTMNNYGLTSPTKFEDSPLLRDIDDAVRNVNPSDKYLSAAVQYRLFYRLLAALPIRWSDAVLDKITDMLYSSYDNSKPNSFNFSRQKDIIFPADSNNQE